MCSSVLERLAAAYGIAVTGTMVVDAPRLSSCLAALGLAALAAALALIAPFLLIDSTFLAANILKIVEGGWMPLLRRRRVIVL